jgi:hypothetical protein
MNQPSGRKKKNLTRQANQINDKRPTTTKQEEKTFPSSFLIRIKKNSGKSIGRVG